MNAERCLMMAEGVTVAPYRIERHRRCSDRRMSNWGRYCDVPERCKYFMSGRCFGPSVAQEQEQE